MPRKERKMISKAPPKEFNLFDDSLGLWFDKIPTNEDECYLVNSRPLSTFDIYGEEVYGEKKKGIDYYVLKRKIYIEE